LAWQVFAADAIAAPALAAAPVLSIKTDIVEITLDVDRGLIAYPGLFDDCVAEGKSYAGWMAGSAAKAHRTDPASFRDGMTWSYDRAYVLRSAIGHYVSVVRTDDTFEGGAHPNHFIDTILWDSQAQRRVSIRRFFGETADDGPTMQALANQAKLAVAAVKIADGIAAGTEDALPRNITPQQYLHDDTFIAGGIEAQLLKIGPVTLAPSNEPGKSSGLTFHYQPYAVGPYVQGAFTAFVPWTEFRRYLSPEGTAIFGGTQPQSDADRW
jgi:hypothetical protein